MIYPFLEFRDGIYPFLFGRFKRLLCMFSRFISSKRIKIEETPSVLRNIKPLKLLFMGYVHFKKITECMVPFRMQLI
jgi:hypothetical protein